MAEVMTDKEPKGITILDLPVELRLTIYKYFLSPIKASLHLSDGPQVQQIHGRPDQRVYKSHPRYLSLLLAHRTFNREAAPVIIKEVAFQVKKCVCFCAQSELQLLSLNIFRPVRYLALPSTSSGVSGVDKTQYLSRFVDMVRAHHGSTFRFEKFETTQEIWVALNQARTAAALVKDLLTIAIDLSFQVIFDMDDHRAYHVKIKADKQGMISMECKKKKQQDGTVIAKAFLIGSKICNEENVHLSRAQRSLAQLPEARRLFDVLVESFQSS